MFRAASIAAVVLLAFLVFLTPTVLGNDGARAQASPDIATLPPWRVPDASTLPDDENGRTIRYGRDLIRHTSALIGPDTNEPSLRFAGNGLECQNCHLDAGTARFGLPLVDTWNHYPTFSARLDKVATITDRINDCMQRSMNGTPLPPNGREIGAIEAYIRFLGSDKAASLGQIGSGVPALPLPERAADPTHGSAVYQTFCSACHQADGSGVRYSPLDAAVHQQRYLFPPLWGPDSYNNGAGMSHNIAAAWFAHANMPRGVTFAYPVIGQDDAYDVAAFINDQPRPEKAELNRDYPNPWLKPADVATPPFLGPFSRQQHALGPWQPIEEWLQHNEAQNEPRARSADDLEAAIGTGK